MGNGSLYLWFPHQCLCPSGPFATLKQKIPCQKILFLLLLFSSCGLALECFANVKKTFLQFEWAWQHPRESVAVREAAAAFKSFSGVASKIKLVYTMLNLPAWNR
jgi:hypothetical protein